jgi:hypothetical protein
MRLEKGYEVLQHEKHDDEACQVNADVHNAVPVKGWFVRELFKPIRLAVKLFPLVHIILHPPHIALAWEFVNG